MCSASVKEVTVQHLANVRAKIASLKKLERALNRMTGTCTPGEPLPCPILEALSAPA
jgi:MerR family mercuric resistance operon transcriptional regulator